MVKRLDRLGINAPPPLGGGAHFDAGLSRGNVSMGGHFDAGLSRGNVLGFKGGQHFIKSLGNATISRENKLNKFSKNKMH